MFKVITKSDLNNALCHEAAFEGVLDKLRERLAGKQHYRD